MAIRRIVLGAVLCTAIVAPSVAGAPQPAGASDATLLARHAPVLVLHPDERFTPVAVNGFLADSVLQLRGASGAWEPAPAGTPLGTAPATSRLDQAACRAVDGPPGEQCYVDSEAAHGSQPTAYGAVFRRGQRVVLQYWLWYPVNVYSPTTPPGPLWIVHEGDWESVTVVLDARERPLVVGLSSHCGGLQRTWGAAPRRGTHPLAYVARGSHAHYFTAGTQRISKIGQRLAERCFTPELIAIYKAYGVELADHTGRGRTVRPSVVRVTASAPEWMRFPGAWGEDQWIGFPTIDPLKQGTGPVGPAFHEQWHRPVAVPLAWPRG